MLNALHQLHFSEIITFVVGALIGILGFSKILNYLLKNHEQVTMAVLIGVMLGSLRVPGVEIVKSVSFSVCYKVYEHTFRKYNSFTVW